MPGGGSEGGSGGFDAATIQDPEERYIAAFEKWHPNAKDTLDNSSDLGADALQQYQAGDVNVIYGTDEYYQSLEQEMMNMRKPVEPGTILYRGTGDLGQFKVGEEVAIENLTPTSFDPALAHQVSSGTVLSYEIGVGGSGVYVGSYDLGNQAEVLLSPGLKFRVARVERVRIEEMHYADLISLTLGDNVGSVKDWMSKWSGRFPKEKAAFDVVRLEMIENVEEAFFEGGPGSGMRNPKVESLEISEDASIIGPESLDNAE